jgi:hypothetical protein
MADIPKKLKFRENFGPVSCYDSCARSVQCDSVHEFQFTRTTFFVKPNFQLYKTDFMQLVSSVYDPPKRLI